MEKTSGVYKIEIKENKYKICYDFNALCWFEETFDISFDEVQKKINNNKYKISDLRNIIAAGLQINAIENDADEMTMKEVKKLISGVNPEELLEMIMVGLEGPSIQ